MHGFLPQAPVPPPIFNSLPFNLRLGASRTILDTPYDVWCYYMFREHMAAVTDDELIQNIQRVESEIRVYIIP